MTATAPKPPHTNFIVPGTCSNHTARLVDCVSVYWPQLAVATEFEYRQQR
jgi:hypothetical protein